MHWSIYEKTAGEMVSPAVFGLSAVLILTIVGTIGIVAGLVLVFVLVLIFVVHYIDPPLIYLD